MKGWLFLLAAITCEIAGTTCLKLSSGMTRPWFVAGMLFFYAGTLACASVAMQHLEIGLVYAVWSGLGTATIAVIGILYFHESISVAKFICLALIIGGVMGLNLTNGNSAIKPVPMADAPNTGR